MIVITADSTCDLGDDLIKEFNVEYFPFCVILDGKEYRDNIDISPDEIYLHYEKNKKVPKTAASSSKEYVDFFKKWTENGDEVIHFNIGSGLSSSFQNASLAAEEIGKGVYVIDSHNLSTGIGLLIIEAANRIENQLPASQIKEEICELRKKIQASFVIDTLEYLHAGGRCSSLALLGTNLLNIHPCIEVDNNSGTMNVGKKYIGSMEKVLKQYTKDKMKQFPNIKRDKVFITHLGISKDKIDIVKQILEKNYEFENIYETRAGCTISSHCGPNTLGVLFITN